MTCKALSLRGWTADFCRCEDGFAVSEFSFFTGTDTIHEACMGPLLMHGGSAALHALHWIFASNR